MPRIQRRLNHIVERKNSSTHGSWALRGAFPYDFLAIDYAIARSREPLQALIWRYRFVGDDSREPRVLYFRNGEEYDPTTSTPDGAA